MTDRNLEKMIVELKELEALKNDLEAEIDSIKDGLKAEMTARNTDDLSVGIHKLRYKAVTSKRFDSKAFKVTHGDLYEQYTKESVSMRFTVA